jgi:hypothetical protein
MTIFSEAIDSNGSNIELLMGKSASSEKLKKFTITVDCVNTLIVEFPDF